MVKSDFHLSQEAELYWLIMKAQKKMCGEIMTNTSSDNLLICDSESTSRSSKSTSRTCTKTSRIIDSVFKKS